MRRFVGSAVRRLLTLAGGAVLLFVAVAAALWFVVGRAAPSLVDGPQARGVRVGMPVDAVRGAFVDGPAGVWSVLPGCLGEDLEWTRRDPAATSTRWARFEFHQGVLAIRNEPAASAAAGPRIAVSFQASTARIGLAEIASLAITRARSSPYSRKQERLLRVRIEAAAPQATARRRAKASASRAVTRSGSSKRRATGSATILAT